MNDIADARPPANPELAVSSSTPERGIGSEAAKSGTVTIAMTPNFGICKSMSPLDTMVIDKDGNVTLYMPVFPRSFPSQIPCNCDCSSTLSDDVDEPFDPPPFPNLAPYKDFYHTAWVHIVLFTDRLLRTTESYDLDAQSYILHSILWYLREKLGAHLPFFGNKTVSQIRLVLEREPSFQQAMLTLKADVDDPLALRTIIHYLCTHPPNPPSVSTYLKEQPSPRGDKQPIRSSKSGACLHPSSDLPAVGNHGDEAPINVPPYIARTYKSQIEARMSDWEDLALSISDCCREVHDAVEDTASLASLVQTLISFINEDHMATTPFFEGLTCAQLDALLAKDEAFAAAVRHLVRRSRLKGWSPFSAALRLVVNHRTHSGSRACPTSESISVCQQRKDGQYPSRRVRFTPE